VTVCGSIEAVTVCEPADGPAPDEALVAGEPALCPPCPFGLGPKPWPLVCGTVGGVCGNVGGVCGNVGGLCDLP
jgi:hypothetical protein